MQMSNLCPQFCLVSCSTSNPQWVNISSHVLSFGMSLYLSINQLLSKAIWLVHGQITPKIPPNSHHDHSLVSFILHSPLVLYSLFPQISHAHALVIPHIPSESRYETALLVGCDMMFKKFQRSSSVSEQAILETIHLLHCRQEPFCTAWAAVLGLLPREDDCSCTGMLLHTVVHWYRAVLAAGIILFPTECLYPYCNPKSTWTTPDKHSCALISLIPSALILTSTTARHLAAAFTLQALLDRSSPMQ